MGRMDNVGQIEFSFGPVIVEKRCSKCGELLPICEFRLRTNSDKRLGMCRMCERKAERARVWKGREDQMPEDAKPQSDRPYPPDPLNVVANQWTGPADRPFVGFCLIDARGLVNLISLDQEGVT
jgi:hypothetical protein